MSTFGGLSVGASGLAAAQRALETAAHNVANANTVGYSRQRVDMSTAQPLLEHRGIFGPGATGQGVNVDSITRATDALVTSNYRDTAAQQAGWETRANFYAQAEQVLGPLDEGSSQALSDFWNSWEALSQAPESRTSREQVLDAGRRIALSLNDAHRRVSDMAGDIGLDMAATVNEVNDAADEVARLNAQIKAARANGDTPNDLLDQRDMALVSLSRLAGGQTSIEADGDARVTLNGMPLVDGAKADVLEVNGAPPNLIWTRDGTTAAAGGELGSLAELVTTSTVDLLAALDEIAVELRDVVNAGHRSGFGLDGVDGRDFFEGTGASDFATHSTLTNAQVAASASGAAADGNHALVMGALRSAVGSAGVAVADLINGLQGSLGLEASHAANQRDMAALVVEDASRVLAQTSGVSTDEELTEMLRFQRAYEASARVITVLDQMLDRLINGTGATR